MKRALVISGGGSKGAFAVGILQQLRSIFPTLQFDIIVGTSTGALIAPLAGAGEYDLLEKLYTTQRTEDIIIKHNIGDRLNEKSIFVVEPLWQRIQASITDYVYEALNKRNREVYLMTVCLQTAELMVYTNNKKPKSSANYRLRSTQNGEHFRRAVLASACQPVFMTPIKVDQGFMPPPEDAFQYVDGGVREYAGIQMALDQGATEIFCVLLASDQKDVHEGEFTKLLPILQRTIATLSIDVEKSDIVLPKAYIQGQTYIRAVKQKMLGAGVAQKEVDEWFRIEGPTNPFEATQPVKLFIIRPETPLGGGPGGLVFDPQEMRGMVERGRGAANAFANTLKEDDVSWQV